MSQPIDVDIPHQLGKAEARRRLETNIGSLERHIPGGAAVANRWDGDTLHLTIHAMGQAVESQIDVRDALVHCRVLLPGMLGLFAGPIAAALKSQGSNLLLEDKRA
ncbi:polyhydroxyalkanoic acid system family protein [Sphingomonas sp. ASV193]|uniref:polyhydroxyalkanoic acid system family protein n=1 Tax=Sphingomonas sp. ASV193 TaxID=3144405 RepID=UPI0032E877DA